MVNKLTIFLCVINDVIEKKNLVIIFFQQCNWYHVNCDYTNLQLIILSEHLSKTAKKS